MALRPTFYGFEMGRSALAASQRNIDITGQNVANINTAGYSRQRVNLAAVGVGAMDKWRWGLRPADNVGLGVDMTGVQRIRDEFLDVRFWKDNSDLNRYETKWNGLDSLEMLLDEFTMPNIQEGLFRFQDALQELSNNSDNEEQAKQVMSIAETLTRTLNKTAVDIETVIHDQLSRMDLVVKNINHIAASIDKINKEIRNQKISTGTYVTDENGEKTVVGGFMSNELLDERDMLIDELSSYGNVRIRKEEGGGISVFFSTNDSGDYFDESLMLVDGTRGEYMSDMTNYLGYEGYFNQLKLFDDEDMTIAEYYEDALERFYDENNKGIESEPFRIFWATGDSADNEIVVTTGQIMGYYEMMNGTGNVELLDEIKTADMASKGIPYFLNMINTFTNTFATVFNEINRGGDEERTESSWEDLFDSSDGEEITARNIRITNEWRASPYMIMRVNEDILSDSGDTDENPNFSADNSNVLKMIYALKSENLEVDFPEFAKLLPKNFKGSFLQYAVSINSEITIEVNYNNKQMSVSEGLVLSLENLRDSIKSVSEDEEAMNLMKFNKSYSAAARYVTVLDEMVDTIVNRLGIVGR